MYLCRSIAERNAKCARGLITEAPMVELRADLMALTAEDIAILAPLAKRTIVTCHTPDCEAIYREAIKAGVWAIDIELDTPESFLRSLIEAAHRNDTKVILSHHFTFTPTTKELIQRGERAVALGADIIKLITTASSTAEALTPLGLYKIFPPERLIAFAMGQMGAFTRRLSLLLGAPYTYVATSKDSSTAEGQPTEDEMRKSFEGKDLPTGLSLPHAVVIPTSKSEAQRAILAATLAKGKSTLYNMPKCSDALDALTVARTLGAKTTLRKNGTLTIEGVGPEEIGVRLGGDIKSISVGESALLARLLMPIVATLLRKGEVVIEGRGTLLTRSLAETIAMLEGFGAECKSDNGHLPVTISAGATMPEDIVLDGSESSQNISGVMMAVPLIDRDEMTRIVVNNAVSRPYVCLTAAIMEQFEAIVTLPNETPLTIDIEPEPYQPSKVRLNTDWSSAGYFAAAYAIAQSGRRPCERYTMEATLGTMQGDEMLLMILSTSGARIQVDKVVEFLPFNRLSAFAYDATHTPDLIPTLAIVALFAEGESVIGGIERLTNKESNRVVSLVENLVAIGGDVRLESNRLYIRGGAPLHSAPIRTHGDHRIAMAFAVAALFMDEKPTLDNLDCVAKSFPDFFELLTNNIADE